MGIAEEGYAGLPDTDLVDALRRDGLASPALDVIIERYGTRVTRLAASVLGPQGAIDPDDVAQDVFVRVATRISGFRGDSSFSTWLYRITRNLALDHRRRARTRDHAARRAVLEPPAGSGGDDQEAREARLRALVDAMPEPSRTILHLHYWQREPLDVIASAMELPVNTVKSHLFRARKRLARVMRLAEEAS